MADIKVPANLQPYIDVLGVDAAAQFFLDFGGSTIYLAKTPTLKSKVAQAIGIDKTAALAELFDRSHVKVPIAKFWLCKYYFEVKRFSKAKIARTLRVDEETVRRWFSPTSPSNQMSLFD